MIKRSGLINTTRKKKARKGQARVQENSRNWSARRAFGNNRKEDLTTAGAAPTPATPPGGGETEPTPARTVRPADDPCTAPRDELVFPGWHGRKGWFPHQMSLGGIRPPGRGRRRRRVTHASSGWSQPAEPAGSGSGQPLAGFAAVRESPWLSRKCACPARQPPPLAAPRLLPAATWLAPGVQGRPFSL